MTGSAEDLRSRVEGFEAFGLRLSCKAADPQAADLVDALVMRGQNEIGSIQRRVIDNGIKPPHVIHQRFELLDEYQGQGFGGSFLRWSDEVYRDLSFAYVELTATRMGSYAWARAGFDFDLENRMYVAFSDHEQAARAMAIAMMLGERLKPETLPALGSSDGVSPHPRTGEEVLRDLQEHGDNEEQSAAAEFARRIPDPAQVRASGPIGDHFLTPAAMAEFDYTSPGQGLGVAKAVMSAGAWFGRKDITSGAVSCEKRL